MDTLEGYGDPEKTSPLPPFKGGFALPAFKGGFALSPFTGGFAGFGVWVDFDSRQVREVHREAT